MASFFENTDRNVIPNWRSLRRTASLGELTSFHLPSTSNTFSEIDIADLLEDWETSPTIGVAADILCSSLTLGLQSSEKIKQIAGFVLTNKEKASPQLLKLAESSLGVKNVEETPSSVMILPDELPGLINPKDIFQKINRVKKCLQENNRNAILWVELARLYSILGHIEKATRSMKNALQLGSNNRYVLRSMARFFVHIQDKEFAHEILRKHEFTKSDPWLMASEVSLALMRGRNSVFTKKAIEIVNSKRVSPFNISELASSVGTIEFHHGNLRKSKDFLKISLVSPNDNALAQAEWISQKENSISSIIPITQGPITSFEALARDFYEKGKFEEAFNCAVRWFLDMPFSISAVLFGSHVAGLLKDYPKAIDLLKAGAISHPNDIRILNDLIFAYCLKGDLKEAEFYLQRVQNAETYDSTYSICITATRGLYYFRKGFDDLGRKFYQSAIESAKNNNNIYLYNLAIVNYAREEVLFDSRNSREVKGRMKELLKIEPSKDVIAIAEEVIRLCEEAEQNKN